MKKHWKKQLHKIIFEADTFWGKAFDIALLIAIILSVLAVILESVEKVDQNYGKILYIIEWAFTIIFTLEYITRIVITKKSFRYILSFFGLIDLLSIIPTYLSLFFIDTHSLLVIRSIRLLRVFRVFKLVQFLGEASQIMTALKASRIKVTVFIGSVFTAVIILGTLMYLVEGGQNGFTSIPKGIYWAIVTLTTVGYGDIAPHTVLGQMIASIVMILGYGVIAVPTGIFTAEIVQQKKTITNSISCLNCSRKGHDGNAQHCKYCGEKL